MSNRDVQPTTNLPAPRDPPVVDLCRALVCQIRGDPPVRAAGHERWTEFREVNDPGSGKKLPNEGHAADEWDSYATVNDPASGKQVPNEGHATDESDAYATVNDPASGKRVPNEGHCAMPAGRFRPPLMVTDTFVRQTEEIYGGFVASDLEYPAMGVTIEGAAIFVECLPYPNAAIVRRQMTDEVHGDHPELVALWNKTLLRHNGKCRYCSVHIHPMDLPCPSAVDIANYERVRTDQRAPNTFAAHEPFPFILINLHDGALQLLGFVVEDGACRPATVERVRDDDARVVAAWERATPLPYFRPEAKIADYIQSLVKPVWAVRFGAKPGEEHTAVLAEHQDGRRVIVRFDPLSPLGLGHDLLDSRAVQIERYVDWRSLLGDLASPAAITPPTAEIAPGVGLNGTSEKATVDSPTKQPVSDKTAQSELSVGRRPRPRARTSTANTRRGPTGS